MLHPLRQCILLIVSACLCLILCRSFVEATEEKFLIKSLLQRYESIGVRGRPVKRKHDCLVVHFGFSLIQILDLDERNQILSINAWLKYSWIDRLLTWKPNDYFNISEIRIPNEKIWKPDIQLYNYADTRLKEHRDVMAVVNYHGKVTWMPPAIFKSTCEIDIRNFPFDVQICFLKFASWTLDGKQLDLHFAEGSPGVNVDDYLENNEWDLVSKPAKRNIRFHECCDVPYPDLTYYLVLKRNPAFYGYLLVLPCVLLSLLTLVIFWLPPESPAKMILGMNIFVAFFLLLLLLADSTPSASKSVPYIGYYYCLNMFLITMSTFLSVIVINLYFRSEKRGDLPRWLKQLLIIASRVMGMNLHKFADLEDKLRLIQHEIRANRSHQRRTRLTNGAVSPHFFSDTYESEQELLFMATDFMSHSNASSSCRHDGGPLSDDLVMQKLELDLKHMRDAARSLINNLNLKDRRQLKAKDWHMMALVLDRIFFWVYLMLIIVSGLALLMPNTSIPTEEALTSPASLTHAQHDLIDFNCTITDS